MKRTLPKSILLVLIIVMTMSLALVGCQSKEYIPDKQGSTVMTMDARDITGTETSVFTSYSSFAGSEFGGMHMDGSNYPAKKSFYRRSYFMKHDLVITKFNDTSGIYHFINTITKKDNTYTVTILRFRDKSTPITKQTYACCLEVPTRDKVNEDTNVILNLQPVYELEDIKSGTSLLESSSPLSLATIASYQELNDYRAIVDEKTASNLASFDEAFFETQALITVDYIGRDNTVFTYSILNGEMNINLYHSDHYTKKSDTMTRHVRYVPVSKSSIINKVMLNTYYEADVGIANHDTHEEIDIRTLSNRQ